MDVLWAEGAFWCDWYSCPGVTIFMVVFEMMIFQKKTLKRF